tara:strand:- start:63 stop:686 length:624 start_codon:yes stop_codon:yes gene_type:complete
MANPLYGSNKFDDSLRSAKYVNNRLAYLTWNWNDLELRAAAESTDAKTDTGFTLVDGQIVESLWDGDGAAASMVLPSATVGALCVFRFSAQADGGTSITFTNASDEYYEAGTITVPVTNLGDKLTGARRPAYLQRWTESVATAGGAIVTVAKTHNTFIIASTATNNQTNIGAEIAWFCDKKGFWKFAFLGSELGSGAINATFATSAV